MSEITKEAEAAADKALLELCEMWGNVAYTPQAVKHLAIAFEAFVAAQPAKDTPKPEEFQCPSCHWHTGHDPVEWFADEAAIRLRYFTATKPGAAPLSYLTTDEQKLMHVALRKSTRLVDETDHEHSK